MKRRIKLKRAAIIVGRCRRCGSPVYNHVSCNAYSGSCVNCDWDLYSFEIVNYKKNRSPVCITNSLYNKLREKFYKDV